MEKPLNPKVTVCRHCEKGKINRPRRLCWACYYRLGVRDTPEESGQKEASPQEASQQGVPMSVREAAERLSSNDTDYWFAVDKLPEAAVEARKVRDAWLDQNPEDDDEPVTLDVLAESIPLIPGYGFVVTEMLSIFNSSKGIRLYFTGGEGDSNLQPIVDITSRRQLRKLLSALRGE